MPRAEGAPGAEGAFDFRIAMVHARIGGMPSFVCTRPAFRAMARAPTG